MLLESELDVQQTHLWFVKQRLVLSSSFKCDQIYKYERYDFGLFVVLLKFHLDV